MRACDKAQGMEALGDRAARRHGPESYSHKELNSADNLNEPGNRSFPSLR